VPVACEQRSEPNGRAARPPNRRTFHVAEDEHSDEASDLDDVDENDADDDGDDDVDEQSEEAVGDDDFEVTFDALPAAVKTTASAEVGSGTITEIDRDVEARGVVFEIDYTRDGAHHEADIAEDGTLLGSHADD
jgi:hypothetical protein